MEARAAWSQKLAEVRSADRVIREAQLTGVDDEVIPSGQYTSKYKGNTANLKVSAPEPECPAPETPEAFQRQATPAPRASPAPLASANPQPMGDHGGTCAGLFGATCTGVRTKKYRGKWLLLCPDCLETQKVKRNTPTVTLEAVEPAAPSPATPSPPEAETTKTTKRKRALTIKQRANKICAVEDAQTAVESARKVSERAAQATQNAEVEAILESRHGASVKSKRLTKKQKQAAAAALDSEENIQDA